MHDSSLERQLISFVHANTPKCIQIIDRFLYVQCGEDISAAEFVTFVENIQHILRTYVRMFYIYVYLRIHCK